MTRTLLFGVGTALFVGLLAWQGAGAVASTLMAAGWGLVVVVAFHLLPLALDAGAIGVLLERSRARPIVDTLRARWIGEAVNSLLPAGQLGGPVVMVRQLTQAGASAPDAIAAVTVSTTLQLLAQIVFALLGLAVFAVHTMQGALTDLRVPAAVAMVLLSMIVVAFYLAQRGGLFARSLGLLAKVFARHDWSSLATRAEAADAAIGALYRAPRKVAATFALSLLGWIVGTGEVWLALQFLGHPVGWVEALFLESVGQAIRGAAFAIPGALGAQEAGYLLLAPLVGLPPGAALALSLAKRARELAFGLPGILFLHRSERNWRRREDRSHPPATVPVVD